MKKLFILFSIFLFSFINCSLAQDADTTTIVNLGEKVPTFCIQNVDGKNICIEDLKGKVVLINFFATWCPPCKAEMPELEDKIWKRFKDKDFVLLSIGREHNLENVQKFKTEKNLSFSLYGDPDRSIYKKFAKAYIPRNFLIDKEGNIVMSMIGFKKEEFEELIEKIDSLIKSDK